MEKNMLVNKIGYDHLSIGMNCQDYGFELPDYKVKVVADGCSEGLHSEVGAKTFCHLLSKGYDIEQAFSSLVAVYGQTIEDMKNEVKLEYDCYGHIGECTEWWKKSYYIEVLEKGYFLA